MSGTPGFSQIDPTIDFSWPAPATPDPVLSSTGDNFSIRWTGQVQTYSSETFTFYVKSDEGARLWVNGTLLVDSWVDQTATEHSGTIALNASVKYDIKLEYYERTGDASVQLSWSSPTTPKQVIPETQLFLPTQAPSVNGLTGYYYDNTAATGGDFTGPTIARVDKTVNFSWGNCATQGVCSPDASMGVTTFSVRWLGYVQAAYNETYTFQTSTDDGVRLWVNGVQLVNKWVVQNANALCPAPAAYSNAVAMTAGVKYPIKMEYYQSVSTATAKLYWSSPSTPCAAIPNNRLFQ